MAENDDTMITTIDNPYNPFNQWDEWYAYDEWKGYHTCSLMARLMPPLTDAASDDLRNDLVQDVYKDLLHLNPFGLYSLVKKTDKTPLKENMN